MIPLDTRNSQIQFAMPDEIHDVLGTALDDVMNRTMPNDTCVSYRRSLLAVSAMIAGTTKYFFIPASMKLPAGPLWASANCVGWFVLEFGFAYEFIQGLMTPTLKSEEDVLKHCKLSKCTQVAIAIPSFAIGAFSQLTAALQALKYNPQTSKLLVTGITAISTGFYPAVSTQEGIVAIYEKVSRFCSPLTELEQGLFRLKNGMLALINANYIAYVGMTRLEKLVHVGEFLDATGIALDQIEKQTRYMRLLLQRVNMPKIQAKKELTKCQKIGSALKILTAAFFTATAEVAGTIYTVTCAKESFNYDNDPFARAMSAIYAGTSFYLTWKLNKWMMGYIGDTARGRREKSTAEQLYPLATNVLASLAFIIDFFSQGAVWQIWGDFSKEKNYENSELYFQITQCAGTFLILFASTLGSIRTLLEFYTQHSKSVDDKEILLLEKQYQKIAMLIEKSSMLHFAIHLSRFPEALKNEILNDLLRAHQITMGNINDYINEKFGKREQLRQPLMAQIK